MLEKRVDTKQEIMIRDENTKKEEHIYFERSKLGMISRVKLSFDLVLFLKGYCQGHGSSIGKYIARSERLKLDTPLLSQRDHYV